MWLLIMQSRHEGSDAYWCRVAVLLLTLCLMNMCGSAITFEEFIGYPFDEVNSVFLVENSLSIATEGVCVS